MDRDAARKVLVELDRQAAAADEFDRICGYQPMVGLFALLNDQQRARALSLREIESFGPPDLIRNTPQ